MAYLTDSQLEKIGIAKFGRDVKISARSVIQNPELLEIGDRSRIDDFCIVSGKVSIGSNVHLAVYSHVSGGSVGVTIKDFAGLAFGAQVLSESDDYSGNSLTNPTISGKFKTPICSPVVLNKHVVIGANSVVLPGVEIGEGTAVGSLTLVNRSLDSWGVYSGIPARRMKERSTTLEHLESQYLEEVELEARNNLGE